MASTQGTYEIMSAGLVDTLRRPGPYLHSPVDDLESFYYTAQWAVACNDGASGGKYKGTGIQRFREMIAGEERARATALVHYVLDPVTAEEEYGPFFAHSLTLLSPWFAKLATMVRSWNGVMHRAAKLDGKDKEKYLGSNFLIYGYRGVTEYFELLREHGASLQGIV